jgi:hypothetical protein
MPHRRHVPPLILGLGFLSLLSLLVSAYLRSGYEGTVTAVPEVVVSKATFPPAEPFRRFVRQSPFRVSKVIPSGNNETTVQGYLQSIGFQSSTCTATEYVQLNISASEPFPSSFVFQLETYSRNDDASASWKRKIIGGDEYDVTVYNKQGQPLAVAAIIDDYYNGTYGLNFVVIPSFHARTFQDLQPHRIQVILQYTCGIGSHEPPSKDSWTTGGHLAVYFDFDISAKSYLAATTLTEQTAATASPLEWATPFSIFERQQQLQHQHNTVTTSNIKWKDYDRVLCFGDSLIQHLVEAVPTSNATRVMLVVSNRMRDSKTDRVIGSSLNDMEKTNQSFPLSRGGQKTHFYYPRNIAAPLNYKTVFIKWIHDFNRYFGARSMDNMIVRNSGRHVLTSGSESWAVIIGSSIWDLLSKESISNARHMQAIRQLMNFLQDDFLQQYPKNNITLIWKSPTAMHVHRVVETDDEDNTTDEQGRRRQQQQEGARIQTSMMHLIPSAEERIRYMSFSRSLQLYREQKALLLQEFPDIVWWDCFWTSAASSFSTVARDGRHYSQAWNQRLMARNIS